MGVFVRFVRLSWDLRLWQGTSKSLVQSGEEAF